MVSNPEATTMKKARLENLVISVWSQTETVPFDEKMPLENLVISVWSQTRGRRRAKKPRLENLVISVWFQISGRYDENVTLDKCVFYYLTDKTPPS